MISIIAAIGKNRELGKDNKIPWHIKADMSHFKNLTTGHPVIMGRKTFESIGKPLPNRENIVITRDSNFVVPGCKIASSIEEAIEYGKQVYPANPANGGRSGEVFIIGGASIYSQAMKYTDKLYLTLVDSSFDADAFFPDYSEFKNVVSKEEGEEGNFKFTFLELTK